METTNRPTISVIPLKGDTYTHFFEEILPVPLEDVSLDFKPQLSFVHDGTPSHVSVRTRQYLNEAYSNYWIGRGVPPRTPNLNPIDFLI